MKTVKTTARTVPANMADTARVAIGNVQSPFKASTQR